MRKVKELVTAGVTGGIFAVTNPLIKDVYNLCGVSVILGCFPLSGSVFGEALECDLVKVCLCTPGEMGRQHDGIRGEATSGFSC